jgi:WhiB family redox-sensing transcriptional regulator
MAGRPLPDGLPPVSIRELGNMMHRANPACVGRPELFFSPDSFEEEPAAEHAARADAAVKVCASCPVRLACLAYAVKTRQESGIWGGLDADAGELTFLSRAAAWPAAVPAGRWTRKPAHLAPPEAAA